MEYPLLRRRGGFMGGKADNLCQIFGRRAVSSQDLAARGGLHALIRGPLRVFRQG